MEKGCGATCQCHGRCEGHGRTRVSRISQRKRRGFALLELLAWMLLNAGYLYEVSGFENSSQIPSQTQKDADFFNQLSLLFETLSWSDHWLRMEKLYCISSEFPIPDSSFEDRRSCVLPTRSNE